jgi:hypothetical protein
MLAGAVTTFAGDGDRTAEVHSTLLDAMLSILANSGFYGVVASVLEAWAGQREVLIKISMVIEILARQGDGAAKFKALRVPKALKAALRGFSDDSDLQRLGARVNGLFNRPGPADVPEVTPLDEAAAGEAMERVNALLAAGEAYGGWRAEGMNRMLKRAILAMVMLMPMVTVGSDPISRC